MHSYTLPRARTARAAEAPPPLQQRQQQRQQREEETASSAAAAATVPSLRADTLRATWAERRCRPTVPPVYAARHAAYLRETSGRLAPRQLHATATAAGGGGYSGTLAPLTASRGSTSSCLPHYTYSWEEAAAAAAAASTSGGDDAAADEGPTLKSVAANLAEGLLRHRLAAVPPAPAAAAPSPLVSAACTTRGGELSPLSEGELGSSAQLAAGGGALGEEEAAARAAVAAAEVWERRVLLEAMMLAHGRRVTRPLQAALAREEAEQRARIVAEEERAWAAGGGGGAAAEALRAEHTRRRRGALQRRQAADRDTLYPTAHPPPRTRSRGTQTDKPPVAWRSAWVPPYLRTPPPSPPPPGSPSPPPSPPPEPRAPTALELLHRHVRATHGAGAAGGGAASVRLLLEHRAAHRGTAAEEARAWAALTAAAAADAERLRDWERRERHVGRLLLWRAQREEREAAAAAALQQAARRAEEEERERRRAAERSALAVEEAAARQAVEAEADGAHAELRLAWAALLGARERLWAECVAGAEELHAEACEALRDGPLAAQEAEQRAALADEWAAWAGGGAAAARAGLDALAYYDTDPRRRAAVLALQRAWRRRRAGRLGWRRTHRALGEELRAARHARHMASARASMAAYRAGVDAQAMRLLERDRAAIAEEERRGRAALETAERETLRRQWALFYEKVLYTYVRPQMHQLRTAEGMRRTELEGNEAQWREYIYRSAADERRQREREAAEEAERRRRAQEQEQQQAQQQASAGDPHSSPDAAAGEGEAERPFTDAAGDAESAAGEKTDADALPELMGEETVPPQPPAPQTHRQSTFLVDSDGMIWGSEY